VSKRFGRSRTATFHTSKPFTIISERIVADCRRNEAALLH
jgi:hypothetical protein